MDARRPERRYDVSMSEPGRQLGLAPAIAIVTGESIALGIFLTPATMAKSLGSPLLLAMVWCGVAVMAFAWTLEHGGLVAHEAA
jgi:APA family basic amino acid/polyamine antiporter